MNAPTHDTDLFCRINVQSDLPFQEFVALVARCANGDGDMNVVRSRYLDISVFENDSFDEVKSRGGDDRWLHFHYTLEVDPIAGVDPRQYVEAVGKFLGSFWDSGLDAVAACEFEDKLPPNERRKTWASGTSVSADKNGQPAQNVGCVAAIPVQQE